VNSGHPIEFFADWSENDESTLWHERFIVIIWFLLIQFILVDQSVKIVF